MADQARYKLAQIESGEGNYDQAVRYYDQILGSNQDPALIPYAQYGRGWALMRLQNYQSAFDSLDRMLKENDQHPLRNDAVLARGISSRNLGKLDQARADLESYLAISPQGTNLGHALYELALIDQKAKDPANAAKKLGRLVREVPDYPSMDKVLYELGWSLQESGNDDAAVKYFTTLINKYPETALVAEAAYFVGQRYYAAGQWELAADKFDVAARNATEPGLSEKVHYRLGWSRFKAEDYEAAETAFAAQAKKHPDGKLALDASMMVGECQFKRADYNAALGSFGVARDTIRENGDNSKSIRDAADRQVRELVFLHGGQSAAQIKSWDVAIEWYDELRKRFPASNYISQVFYETGFAYQQKGDQTNALKFFREVANNFRNELAARARFMIGEIYFADRQFDKAIPEFQRVMFGFGAEKAPDRIKNWQAKSGFEAARCSELLMQSAKTRRSRDQALEYARKFYTYVIEKHRSHELAAKSRERIEALKQ
jgi:tetratricopeptide (TPR) repeat protein